MDFIVKKSLKCIHKWHFFVNIICKYFLKIESTLQVQIEYN